MADGLSTANANLAAAAAVGTNAAFAQLHTGDPGSAGTTAVASVTTRPALTWAGASGGAVAANGTLPSWSSWAGTNGQVITDLSTWSLSSAGTFGLSTTLSASVTMNTGDNLALTSWTVTLPTAS
jgi:hypothetical protein